MSVEQGRCQESQGESQPCQLSLFQDPGPTSLDSAPVRRPAQGPEEILARDFRDRLAGIVWTENRLRIASLAPEGPGSARFILRLHRCFRKAPRPVLRAVAAWALGRRATRRAALAELRAFFEQAAPQGDRSERRPSCAAPQGRTYDLAEIFADLNRVYFGDQIAAQISWGRAHAAGRKKRRSMLLGSYSYDHRLIRIHPRLDDPTIPRFVVATVVHHEMVHAYLPAPHPAVRRDLHSAEFRQLERSFSDYEQAQAWLREHLPKLLRTCGTGSRQNR